MDERPPKKASPLKALLMVLSAFVGIRKAGGEEEVTPTPGQIIIIGIVAAACFVGGLVLIVRLVTG